MYSPNRRPWTTSGSTRGGRTRMYPSPTRAAESARAAAATLATVQPKVVDARARTRMATVCTPGLHNSTECTYVELRQRRFGGPKHRHTQTN